MNRILIMAGGTGGHVFPGLAVATHLKTLNWHVEWIGTRDKMEAELVPKYGFNIHFIDIAGIRKKGIYSLIIAPWKLTKAFFQARKLLRRAKPNVVLGMGGYASGPGALAAFSLGIPIVVHEQNAVFGLTNRYLAKLAKKVLTGFDFSIDTIAKQPSQSYFVGNPIRADFFDIQPISVDTSESNVTNILIVGGSLGALAINQIAPPILIELSKRFSIQVIHQTGKGKLKPVLDAYSNVDFAIAKEFIDDIATSFAWADIIICRAGALTVAEVAGAGRTAIFVPLPSAVDDHQTANAQNLSEQGAAILLPQTQLVDDLYSHLERLCSSRQDLASIGMKARELAQHNATANIIEHLQEVALDSGS